jgi:transposase
MHKEDGRHLSPVEKHQMRKMVVRGHNRGRTPRQISEDTGLTDSGVRQILKKYLAGGMKAIAPCKVGRKSGTKRVLSPEQEQLIQKMIQDDRPEQLKLEFALWTREAVRQLIKRECKVELVLSPAST